MIRPRLVCTLALLLSRLLSPVAADAQEAAKVARIGYLAANRAAGLHLEAAFLRGLRDLGYAEGRNLVIEYRDAGGKLDRLSALAAELVALKVDVIVAPSKVAAPIARQATKTVPVVFALVADPVGNGLVTSLARPGGNVTGLSVLDMDLAGKRLELLKQAVPGVGRIAILWKPGDADERAQRNQLKEAEASARALGMPLQLVEARSPGDLDRAFSEMHTAGVGAVMVLGNVVFFSERRRLVGLAAKNGLPAMYNAPDFVHAGGLMSYSVNFQDVFRRCAVYVDKILKGAKPGELPVEQPTKFELVINLKAAKTLGLTISPSVLARADRVVEK